MTSASDNDYKVELTYGTIGLSSQVYEEMQSYVGGATYKKTVTKIHDANGNVVAETYPSGLDLDRTWTDIDRLSTVTDGTNTIASYGYVGGRVKTVGFQNGSTVTTTFTGFRSEVARIHHQTSSPATIVDLQYGYDNNHDRIYERFGASGQPGEGFAYDKARRLTTAWMGSATPSSPSAAAYVKKIDYAMDDDGNRDSVAVTPYGQGTTTTNYTSNTLNQYTAVGGASPSHDSNGNLTDDGTLAFKYDYRNQIVKVKQSSTTIAEYKYDALGRRVEKDDQSTVERYIYSGAETVAVYDGSNAWIRDFVFGAVIDEVLMIEQADVLDYDSDSNTTETTRSFYHRNALGSVMEITDMNEAEVVSYRYDPYGAVTITVGGTPESSDPLGNPWMYTARFHDEESGLEYYRARYYSTVIGRFLQRDPEGYGQSPNLQQYAGSHPTTATDPSGRWWWLVVPLLPLLSGCGHKGSARDRCKCKIVCDAKVTPAPYSYAHDYQWRDLGSCLEVGGDAACRELCREVAQDIASELNNELSDLKEDPDAVWENRIGVKYVKQSVTNPQTGNTDHHDTVPYNGAWICRGHGGCQ